MKATSTFLLLFTFFTCIGFSQPFDHIPSPTVVYRDVDLYAVGQQPSTSATLDVDIDDDGTNDILFKITPASSSAIWTNAYPSKDNGSTKFLSIDSYFCISNQYLGTTQEPGTTIEGNSSSWNGQDIDSPGRQVYLGTSHCELPETFIGKGYSYLGVQFRKGGNTHYAWLKLNINIFPTGFGDAMDIRVIGIAYESVTNKEIVVGDDGKDVVESVSVQGENGATEITEDLGKLQMEASLLPQEAQFRGVKWRLRNGDNEFASIDSEGLLSAKKNGIVRVYGIADDINQEIDSVDIVISNQKKHIESIEIIAKNGGDIKIDSDYGTLELDVIFTPMNVEEEFKQITWSIQGGSDPDGFCSVDSVTGIVQAYNNIAAEIIYVKATSADPIGASTTVDITITNQTNRFAKLELRTVDGDPIIDEKEGVLELRALRTPWSELDIQWKVINEELATITPKGENFALADLQAQIDGVAKVVSYWEDPSVVDRVVSDTLKVTITNQNGTGLLIHKMHLKNTLYPNPANQNSIVSIDDALIIKSIEIYDHTGNHLKSQLGVGNKIEIEGMQPGLYIIIINSINDIYWYERLIIKD